jgi:hypothetical protein
MARSKSEKSLQAYVEEEEPEGVTAESSTGSNAGQNVSIEQSRKAQLDASAQKAANLARAE